MVWFIKDLGRLDRERRAIAELQSSASWLKGVDWTIAEGGRLVVDAEIEAHGHVYLARMVYPAFFPEAPPIVRPKDAGENWSIHQYTSGTLCLEWGPDNWRSDITGAQMLESAYRLLHAENPRGTERHAVLPSRHALSLGQEIKDAFLLFYVSGAFKEFLRTLPDHSTGEMRHVLLCRQRTTWLVYLLTVTPTVAGKWEDTSLPVGFQKEDTREGVYYKTNLGAEDVDSIKNVADLKGALENAGLESALVSQFPADRPMFILLIGAENSIHLFLLVDPQKGNLYRAYNLDVSGDVQGLRLPPELMKLSGKKVGIVGLGSVGSKVTMSLARTGIGGFVLSDDDVFLPGNACRHSLDWRSLGEHKVKAITQVLEFLGPNVTVDANTVSITGQESTATVNGVLDRLSHCDLLVDATANAAAFNIISAIAVAQSIPLVWMEVFPGGVGGMVARYRPGIDPDPKTMRLGYLQFTQEHPFPDLAVTAEYVGEDTEGNPIVATDADVSVIASYATELAIDSLLCPETSAFPFSMYLVGLRKFWVFAAPFCTIQIPTDYLHRNAEEKHPSAEAMEEGGKFLLGILQRLDSDTIA
jgi:hypothetical protein